MAVAGLGNALFHVGAGAAALSVDPGRASAPGIFVGPGALGLAAGLFLGRTGEVPTVPFVLGLALAAGVVMSLGNVRPPATLPTPRPVPSAVWVIAVLLLFSIAIRAFVGMAGCHACPKLDWLPWAMATAACLGKVSGGVIADRIGWARASVGALVLSAPLIAFGSGTPALMVLGMFLFQMTMPVTLVALHILWPRMPGFAFGLACVALVAGALLTSLPAARLLYGELPFLALIRVSAAALWGALHLLKTAPRAARGSPAAAARPPDQSLNFG
jgi:FSR family fosmidomycin resistance protein-like MFS transporter